MAAPCSRCGATKTEPIRRGWRQSLARGFGYDLRKCARCRKLRLIDCGARTASSGAASSAPEPGAHGPAYGPGAFRDPDDFHGCPRCGGPEFHRTRRRWLERVLSRPRMARCRACGYRFPIPQA
jgi:hypothetical protein